MQRDLAYLRYIHDLAVPDHNHRPLIIFGDPTSQVSWQTRMHDSKLMAFMSDHNSRLKSSAATATWRNISSVHKPYARGYEIATMICTALACPRKSAFQTLASSLVLEKYILVVTIVIRKPPGIVNGSHGISPSYIETISANSSGEARSHKT